MRVSATAIVVGLGVCVGSGALAQVPVDSNIAVTAYAQTRGIAPCVSRGDAGCGGCYPSGIPDPNPLLAALQQLSAVNPPWQPIGPMIIGGDASLPPNAIPVRLEGTVALSKSPGDDFPSTHLTTDYNAEVIPDDTSLLGTGNTGGKVEFEYERDKFPMFAWAGEGDRVIAVGRWIFDCGHPNAGPLGKCSNNATQDCILDADCTSPGTCTAPAPVFGFQSELHPPQAVAMIRTKSLPASRIGRTAPAIPATRADVYISADGGGASDKCVVKHLTNSSDVLYLKACFINRCSVTTFRECRVDKDCGGGETCVRLDPNNRLTNINATNFEFDIPLPPRPSATSTLQIKTKNFKPRGGIMPKAIFQPTLVPTPNLHVIVPMATPLPGNKLPNVFAQRISAGWKEDTTSLTHVQVKLVSVTINNPLKDSTPAVPRTCANPYPPGGLTTTACSTDYDCAPGTCFNSGAACHTDKDCVKKTDACGNHASCVGGTVPGWELWSEINGDWVKLKDLDTLGTKAPFLAAPYVQPSPTPLAIKQNFKFDEFVPPSGSIHLKVSGHSLNCLNGQFGRDLVEGLHQVGLVAGAQCLLAGSLGTGIIDLTHNGPTFGTTAPGLPATFNVTSSGGEGGTCSMTTSRLCVSSADCPMGESCTVTGGAFTATYTVTIVP